MLVLPRLAMRSLWSAAAVLLAGCVIRPEVDPNESMVVEAVPTSEEIQAQNEQDIEAARQAAEWQSYVCGQPASERKRLIVETAEKYGWQIACPDTGT